MPRRKQLGCLACREMHMRCDKLQPKCTPCTKSRQNRPCIYPESPVGSTRSPSSNPTSVSSGPSQARQGGNVSRSDSLATPSSFTDHCEGLTSSTNEYLSELDRHVFGYSELSSSSHIDPTIFKHTPEHFSDFLSARLQQSDLLSDDVLSGQLWQPSFGEPESHVFDFYLRIAAPWLDAAAPSRYFSESVAQLALTTPLLYHVCLSYASRVLFLRGQFDEGLHNYYYETAIRLLIHELSKETGQASYEILASTTAILRMREQFTETRLDGEFHLHGASSVFALSGLKTSVQSTDGSGAPFWLFVRQTIRAGFLHEQKYTCVLAQIEDVSTWSANTDDHDVAWTNRVTSLLAWLCNLCWGRLDTQHRDQDLEQTQTLLEKWKERLPRSFEPWCDTLLPGNVLPTIRFVSTWHTIAWQFYYAARVVLAVYSPSRPASNDLVRMSRYINGNIVEPTKRLCAICLSDTAEGSQFIGIQLIGWCARFLTREDEQHVVLQYVTSFMEQKRWPCQTDISRLEEAWRDGISVTSGRN